MNILVTDEDGSIGYALIHKTTNYLNNIDAVFNLNAESYIPTSSIFHSEAFIQTNIVRTC